MWKIQLTIGINFISSEDVDEGPVMHSKSNNIELMLYDDSNEVVDKMYKSILLRYQVGLETPMRRSHFRFFSIAVIQISQIKF